MTMTTTTTNPALQPPADMRRASPAERVRTLREAVSLIHVLGGDDTGSWEQFLADLHDDLVDDDDKLATVAAGLFGLFAEIRDGAAEAGLLGIPDEIFADFEARLEQRAATSGEAQR